MKLNAKYIVPGVDSDVEWVMPVYINHSLNRERNVLCVISYQDRMSSDWLRTSTFNNASLYTEEVLTVEHKGQSFQLDLNKARKLGLIK